MTSISIGDKERQGLLGSVLELVTKEPVTLREAGEDVAVVLSPEQFEAFANIRQSQLEDFFAARAKVAASAKRNGLTEAALAEILSE